MSDLQIFLILSGVVLTALAVYSPDRVVVQQGCPVRFTFTRQESGVCSERVLFPDFNKHVSFPEYEQTTLEFTPTEPGKYDFHCHMGMLHGTLIIK